MRGLPRGSKLLRAPGVLAALVVFGLFTAGCSGASSVNAAGSSGQPVESASAVQMCADCNGKGAPPQIQGAARDENGVQVAEIGVKNGYYAPNAITAKAGIPLRIVFSGSAKGCLAKPTFSTLGKKADFTGGTAEVDLGTLKAGTYVFTCAMGKNRGTITLR